MSRKKIELNKKKKSFGVTIDPEIDKILKELTEKENITKSDIIEKALKEFVNKK